MNDKINNVKWDTAFAGSEDTLYKSLWRGAQNISDKLSLWRRAFHMNPELSGQENQTARTILNELRSMGIDADTVPGQNAVVGHVYGSNPGGISAIRADMDALPIQEVPGRDYGSTVPGVMHACGHDAHVAIQLGAALLLKESAAHWNGEVRLLFEPAEETVGGAQPMVDAGCMRGVSSVFGLHMAPNLPVGQLWTRKGAMSGSSSEVVLNVKGAGCHGAYPEKGVDAIVLASQVVGALQTIVSRTISAFDNVVLTIGMVHGGTAPNIIASGVILHGTLRALDGAIMARAQERVRAIAQGVCQASGGSCDVEFLSGYHAVICADKYVDQLFSLCGDIGVEPLVKPTPSLGVDSFGDFTAAAPGLYYDLGCASAPDSPSIHTPQFDIDESCLPIGAFLQAALSAREASV